jgi:hypothetical protein
LRTPHPDSRVCAPGEKGSGEGEEADQHQRKAADHRLPTVALPRVGLRPGRHDGRHQPVDLQAKPLDEIGFQNPGISHLHAGDRL